MIGGIICSNFKENKGKRRRAITFLRVAYLCWNRHGMEEIMNREKMDNFLSSVKLNELLRKEEECEKKKSKLLWICAIAGAVVAVAAIAYGVYRFFTPDYLEDFEDDFDDDFEEEDFFDDEDEKE
jgi:hypothetical protein